MACCTSVRLAYLSSLEFMNLSIFKISQNSLVPFQLTAGCCYLKYFIFLLCVLLEHVKETSIGRNDKLLLCHLLFISTFVFYWAIILPSIEIGLT